jgi:hypothetical protein
MVGKGCFKLLKPPQDIKALNDALDVYNAHHQTKLDRVESGLPSPSPTLPLPITTLPKSQARARYPSVSESDAPVQSSLLPPTLPLSPHSPFSPFSLSSLLSVSSPAPPEVVAKPGAATPPGDGGHPEVLGQVHRSAIASGRAIVKPLVFTKEILDECCMAWLLEKKTKKRAVATPDQYRQPAEKTLAFIMALAS